MSFELDSREFERGLRDALADIRRELERGLRSLGEDAVSVARHRAPVLTGELRSSIAADTSSGPGEIAVEAGTDDPTGIYQEFGTSRMPPHPFMRPAFAEALNQFLARVRRI
jgi:HK97 gp10 family phage protein